ncbi:Fructosamine kinase-domain-containing protein [Xylariaceae sp. FL0594]|nr:Fructosamine kinase-domain-containing protein [Xylariaceae sp. FL0594]
MAPVKPIQGDFPLDDSIIGVLPQGTTVLSAKSWALSAWTRTARIDTQLQDGTLKSYFLKCVNGKLAQIHIWGEHYSASLVAECAPECGSHPVGKGVYMDENNDNAVRYFYVQDFHDMDTEKPPDPSGLAATMATIHGNSASPNGLFGYPIVTGRGTPDRVAEHWSDSWAEQFTYLLTDLIKLDNCVKGSWREYDAACKQLISGVVPRLLGVLQTEGRTIEPSLVHGDLWEGNVATDKKTGKVIMFDFDECTYAHNEMEMGTWRCRWATHFFISLLSSVSSSSDGKMERPSSKYVDAYKREIPPSEPAEEFDDRNRLYAIKAAICDSAGHRGSVSRQLAYNDILFLCEKYAPLESLEKYDPQKDISVTGIKDKYDVMAGILN